MAIQTAAPVTVSLHELEAGSVPLARLAQAFGPDSLGILVVTGLPAAFAPLRRRVLRSASRLAALPPAQLAALTRAEAKYLVGWSHGVETLRPGVVDTAKGSYYVNCAFYADPALEAAAASAASPNLAEYTTANVWPAEADVPGFRADVEQLVGLIIDTAALVARACDRYGAREVDAYPPGGFLERVVRTSTTTKARLLHYFPRASPSRGGGGGGGGEEEEEEKEEDDDDDDDDDDSWCATHVDHGCLTGLTSAMFVDEAADAELAAAPDARAGLYVRARTGRTYRVAIPRDALAFQTGQALELITRGRFKAVPHFVRGLGPGAGARVARNTLAVFTQPNLDELVDHAAHTTFGDFARGVVKRNTAA